MTRAIIAALLVLLRFIPATGQKITPSPADLYTDALEFMFAGDYSDALPALIEIQNRGFGSPNISYKIGECYLSIQGQKLKAIPYLKEASQNVSGSYSGATLEEEEAPYKALLYLGIAYRLNNDFENAISCFNEYLNKIDDVDKEEIGLAEFHIERCTFARELMASPAEFTSDTLSGRINTSASNFNPLVTSDEKGLFYEDKLKFYDAVMYSVKTDTGWQFPKNLTPEIKSDGDHYITGISTDGTQLFLTAYDPYLSGELFSAEYKNGQWSEMVKLNSSINTLFNETHASLSPDGHVLYFTSDRKGGYGGMDIYRSFKTPTGEWGQPVNLGPLINTPFNEESPFVSSNAAKLFFSSQGHYNMGGYDVFSSTLGDDGNWLPPVNIGYPLNSTDDDLFFFPLEGGDIGYQSRFTSSTGQTDIVRYLIKTNGNPARFMVNGKIDLIADPGYHAGNISIAFIDVVANDTVIVKPLQDDGSFRQKLPGGSYKLDFSEGTKSLLTRDLEIPGYFPHNNLVLHEEITVPTGMIFDTLYLKDIRYAFNKSKFDEVYQTYLDNIIKVMIKYPGLSLQVNGYADAMGNENYNRELSRIRAIGVADYMKVAGLSDRISLNGLGEKNPVAMNANADGTDNPEGRSYNRRVELLFSGAPKELVIVKFSYIPEAILLK